MFLISINLLSPHPLAIAGVIIGIFVIVFLILVAANGLSLKESSLIVLMAGSIQKSGYSNIITIWAIKSVIKKHLQKDGFIIKRFDIVHEMEGRYHGLVDSYNYGRIKLNIIADSMGNLQWKWFKICPKCGNTLSTKNLTCPVCGYTNSNPQQGGQPNQQQQPLKQQQQNQHTQNLQQHQNTPQQPTSYTETKKDGKGNEPFLITTIVILALMVAVLGFLYFTNESKDGGSTAKVEEIAGSSKTKKQKEASKAKVEEKIEKNQVKKDKQESQTTKERSETTSISEFEEVAISHNSPNAENSNPKKLKVSKVTSKWHLNPQAGNTYEASHMCDGKPSTTWAVTLTDKYGDENPQLEWEWINMGCWLEGPVFYVKCKKLSHIILYNGYCKNQASFKNNSRAAYISFYNCDLDGPPFGSSLFSGDLKDTMKPQRLDVSLNEETNHDIKKIQMVFTDFYHGEKWDDLCISEVEFWGYE